MYVILLSLVLSILSSCGGGHVRREYPWKPQKDQQFIGHNGYGFGVLKDKDTLFYGNFRNGYKEGLFKVVYPNSDYVYRFYKKNSAFYDVTKLGSFAVVNQRPVATYTRSDYSDKSLTIDETSKEVQIKAGSRCFLANKFAVHMFSCIFLTQNNFSTCGERNYFSLEEKCRKTHFKQTQS